METQTDQKVYYSPFAGLTATVNAGRRVIGGDGRSFLDGAKEVQFQPQGDNWGRCVTRDPEIIAYLDNRIATKGDVFDAKAYLEKTTPPQIRAEQAEAEARRVVIDNNRLLQRVTELEARLAQQPQRPVPQQPQK